MKILQNASNYLAVDMAQNTRRYDTSFIFYFLVNHILQTALNIYNKIRKEIKATKYAAETGSYGAHGGADG